MWPGRLAEIGRSEPGQVGEGLSGMANEAAVAVGVKVGQSGAGVVLSDVGQPITSVPRRPQPIARLASGVDADGAAVRISGTHRREADELRTAQGGGPSRVNVWRQFVVDALRLASLMPIADEFE